MDVVVGSERRPDLGLVDPPCRAKQLPPDHTPAREIQMVFIGDPVQPADRILRYPDDAQIHAWDKTTGGKVTLSDRKESTLPLSSPKWRRQILPYRWMWLGSVCHKIIVIYQHDLCIS